MQAKQRRTAKGEKTKQRGQENGAQRCPARSSQAAVAAVEWKLRVDAIPIASSPPARGAPARQRHRTLPDIHAPPEQARPTSGPKIEVDRIHCTVRRTAVAAHAQRVLLSHYAVGKVPGDAERVPVHSWKAPAPKHGESDDERPDALLVSLPPVESNLAPASSAAGSVLCVWREDMSAVALLEVRCRALVAHRHSYAVVDLSCGDPTNSMGLTLVQCSSLIFCFSNARPFTCLMTASLQGGMHGGRERTWVRLPLTCTLP